MQASIGGALAAWECVEAAAIVTHPRRRMWVKQRHCILRRRRCHVGRWHGRSRRRRRRCRSLRRIYVGNARSRCSWWGRRSLAVRRHGGRGRHGCCKVHRRRRGARHAKLRHCRRGSGRITGRCTAHPVRHRLPIRRRLAERRKEGIHILLCTYSVTSTSFVPWYVLRWHAAMRHGHRRAGRGEEHGCAGREKHASLPHWGATMEVCSFQRAARTGVHARRQAVTHAVKHTRARPPTAPIVSVLWLASRATRRTFFLAFPSACVGANTSSDGGGDHSAPSASGGEASPAPPSMLLGNSSRLPPRSTGVGCTTLAMPPSVAVPAAPLDGGARVVSRDTPPFDARTRFGTGSTSSESLLPGSGDAAGYDTVGIGGSGSANMSASGVPGRQWCGDGDGGVASVARPCGLLRCGGVRCCAGLGGAASASARAAAGGIVCAPAVPSPSDARVSACASDRGAAGGDEGGAFITACGAAACRRLLRGRASVATGSAAAFEPGAGCSSSPVVAMMNSACTGAWSRYTNRGSPP